jgi:hypothetical protein
MLSVARDRPGSVAYVASVGPPAVESAVEDPVRAAQEGFAVVRARDRAALLLGFVLGAGFSKDVSELFPGDGSSSGLAGAAVPSSSGMSSASLVGPPCKVILGMVPSSM